MKVAILNTNIVTNVNALTALTPSSNDIVYVESLDIVCYFRDNVGSGDYAPNVGAGFWVIDTILFSSLLESVEDDYDFITNSKTQITSVQLLDKYGEHRFGYKRTRDIIKAIVATDTAMYTTWATYGYKDIAVKWFAAPYSLRLGLRSESVDADEWEGLVDKTKGIEISTLTGRSLIIELMRRCVSHELRKEIMTKSQLDDFYFSTVNDFEAYINTNSNKFSDWLYNINDHINDGFASKTIAPNDYYNVQLELKLKNIYNGVY